MAPFFLPNIRFYSVTSLRKYHAIPAHILLRILPEGVVILQSFSGIFNSRRPGVFLDAPCLQLGRHFLSGKGAARSGPIAALAVGHIRNAAALRRELGPSTAATFSELLLQAYRAWGEDCVRRVEGPCALIVIDQEHDCLLLSRDRMGEVPFYYSIRGGEVLFGSHPAPLLRLGVLAEVDSSGLCEVFGLGPARTPGKTPYRDLLALEPGHMLTVQSGRAKVRAYFELTACEHTDSLPDTIEAVRSLLAQAVADAAPLEPAAMLSGGLDSCALTALLARQTDRPVVTYSVDYEGNEQFFKGGSYQPEQDAPYVELAAQAIGTRHERIVLPVEALAQSLDAAMAARGFPGMADIDSSLYLFAGEIAKSHRYALSGECADEVFGGYPWFHREALIHADCFPWSGSLPLRQRILRPEIAQKLHVEEYVRDTYARELAQAPRLSGECPLDERLRALQALCFRYFMTNLQERAVCMCNSFDLQVLTPFCDERLVQYVFNVPWSIKNTGGMEKGLLRAAMEGVLPDKLRLRRKSPYPKTYHPLYAQAIRGRVQALLADSQAPLWQLADPQTVRSLAEGPLSPQETPWFGQLMAGPQMLAYLLQVDSWLRRYRVVIV